MLFPKSKNSLYSPPIYTSEHILLSILYTTPMALTERISLTVWNSLSSGFFYILITLMLIP